MEGGEGNGKEWEMWRLGREVYWLLWNYIVILLINNGHVSPITGSSYQGIIITP
jgi:hypothetical protein